MAEDLEMYQAFRDYIKHEDILRGNRTGWLLTSQAFLFAAEGAIIDKTGALVVSTQIIVALLGIAVALIAKSRADTQLEVYASVEEAYRARGASPGLPNLRFGTKPFSKVKQYALSYPFVFMLAWVLFVAALVIFKAVGKS